MPPHRLHQYAHTKFSYARGSPEDTVAARKCCLANIASHKCTRIQQTRSDPAKSMLGVWRMKECNRANRPELEESTASGAVPAPTQHTFVKVDASSASLVHSSQGLTGHSTQCQRETHRAKVQNKKTWPWKQPLYHGSCVTKIAMME